MIDLFARMPHTWFRVGQVQAHLERCGVLVHRNHVHAALNQLVDQLGFLEKRAYAQRGRITLHRYRRKMTDLQREVAIRGSKKRTLSEVMSVRYD